jgi:hypothetical protein
MKRLIRGAIAAAGLALALGAVPLAAGAEPAPLSPEAAAPCEYLAQVARRAPINAWDWSVKALEPALHVEQARTVGNSKFTLPHPATAFETELAQSLDLDEGLGSNGYTVFVEHIASTELYAFYSVQGTLHCQDEMLVQAGPGKSPRELDKPPAYAGELCWTQSADLGEWRGRPVFLTHGLRDSTGFDQDLQITPWTGGGWGPACRLSLTFNTAYRIDHQYCGDPAVCRLGGGVAREIARLYGQRGNRAGGPFAFGASATPEVRAKASTLRGQATAEFPTLGAPDDYAWSYSDFAYFPLVLAGRSYLAAIGHEGVGWREGNKTLLAIYDGRAEPLKPLASFVISRSPTKLAGALVGQPVPEGEDP